MKRLTTPLLLSAAFAALGVLNSAGAQGFVQWNTLGSSAEVLLSEQGTSLSFYAGPGNIAVPDYVPGPFGSALGMGPGGTYVNNAMAHNVVLGGLGLTLNPERGTLEIWYLQVLEPSVINDYGIYRLVYGVGFDAGLDLDVQGPTFGPTRITFRLHMGGGTVTPKSLSDGLAGVPAAPYTGQWIHLRAAWDRAGIDGTTDTVRLSIDGTPVATETSTAWGTTPGTQAGICGGHDSQIAGKFYVDEIKLWDHARGDYLGTADDFTLTTSVGGGQDPSDPSKGASPGQVLSVSFGSLGGTLVSGVPLLAANFVPSTATPSGVQALPGLHVSLGSLLILFDGFATSSTPIGPTILGSGLNFSYLTPPGITGNVLRVQAVIVSPASLNGAYALSEALDFVFI